MTTDGQIQPLIRLSDARVVLNGQPILDALNWQLLPGQNCLLTGANGAGKSSFLKLLAGEIWPAPPARGRRVYDFGSGPEMDAVRARSCVALVSPELQDRYVRFRWNLPTSDVVATGLYGSSILRKRPAARQWQNVADWLERVELDGLDDMPFLRLSRGQQRRALLARAMVAAPHVLLLDEVCDSLDRTAGRRVIRILDEATRSSGVTMVYATHQPSERPQSLTRAIEISNRQMRESRLDSRTTARRSRKVRRSTATASGTTLVQLSDASVYRGGNRILGPLNWSLHAGEHWCITGENGAGKTTFLMLLHGALRPALGGSIRWLDIQPSDGLAAVRRAVALVSPELQSDYRDPVSVRECVATGINSSIGVIPRMGESETRAVSDSLSSVGLDSIASRQIRSLSYGQFRLVLLARALVLKPRVLLLDEALGGLDAANRDQMLGVFRRLAAAGTSIVIASHEGVPDPGLFTHSLELSDGRIRHARPV